MYYERKLRDKKKDNMAVRPGIIIHDDNADAYG